ncbi:MAG TPA: DUF3604 domain-containing protein [Porticoccus sp.]|nr:DUF3604 domain-containing protein [Porticoccus sp.]
MRRYFLLSMVTLLLQACGNSADIAQPKEKTIDPLDAVSADASSASVSVQSSYPEKPFFGDTHIHTNLSLDAGAFGNRLGLDAAYEFARGDQVTSTTGISAQLSRPLDFVVIADHSDGMGIFPDLLNNRGSIMNTAEGKRWSQWLKEGKTTELAVDIISNFSQGTLSYKSNDPAMMTPVWKSIVDAADKYNQPGVFTALIGYEWTSLVKGNNLHRVVIFKDDGDKAIQQLPFTNEDSSDPELLWENLAAYEKLTGGKVLAIPHNGNLSNGMMFMEETLSGDAFNEDYVKRRIQWEPLYEVTQIKGDGEAHPFLSPDDEFADFENWDRANLDFSQLKTDDMLEYEYGRSALKLGLKIKQSLGTNPYKFGMIGSTDSHTSLATADDNNFFGKASSVEPSPTRSIKPFVKSKNGTIYNWETVSSGYAAVWAHENTRESLWDAMRRKETYATTGSRMTVRFFGGWVFSANDLNGDLVAAGYQKGVPMGGDLTKPSNAAPSFIVAAIQDPEGGSLDRIQIIKGWLGQDGKLAEKVYDVVWSGDRKKAENGKVPLIANTVSLEDGSWDNTTGSAQLNAVWVDPDFDPSLEAFYYVRVIEIPTPRWTLYDKIRYGIELDENIPLINTERAYTSPIWYSPQK